MSTKVVDPASSSKHPKIDVIILNPRIASMPKRTYLTPRPLYDLSMTRRGVFDIFPLHAKNRPAYPIVDSLHDPREYLLALILHLHRPSGMSTDIKRMSKLPPAQCVHSSVILLVPMHIQYRLNLHPQHPSDQPSPRHERDDPQRSNKRAQPQRR